MVTSILVRKAPVKSKAVWTIQMTLFKYSLSSHHYLNGVPSSGLNDWMAMCLIGRNLNSS